jgi:CO/xanthine dehydrogenase Mo-binding subunit
MPVGTPLRRPDAPDKLRGRARYLPDVRLAGARYARLVLSPHPHARILEVDAREALEVWGVEGVYTARELGEAGLLAQEEVLYVGHPVAVVVARDPYAAEDGAERVRVTYEPLPTVVDPEAALKPDSPPTRTQKGRGSADAEAHGSAVAGEEGEDHPRNAGQVVTFRRGQAEEAWARTAVVVEDTFFVPRVHQGYLETQGVAALEESGRITIWASTQGAFFSRRYAAQLTGHGEMDLRVVATEVGGGFGGKTGLLEPLAARLAEVTKKPVVLTLDRSQDMLVARPAPGARVTLRLGADREGNLTALEAYILFDAGADRGAPVGIAALLLGSVYRVPYLSIRSVEALTHKTPPGAYRAPGAPQVAFALEVAMNRLARQLGMDPIELRRKNLSLPGDPMADGRPWPAHGAAQVLEAMANHPLWRERHRLGPDEGIGVALGVWPGGLEPAAAACRVNPDGTVTVLTGSTNLTGTNTALAAIAAEALGLDPERVRVVQGDTDTAPFAGMAGGSKITYTVGRAVLLAAQEVRRQVLELAAQRLEADPQDLEIRQGRVEVRGVPARSLSLEELAQLSTRFGSPYAPLEGEGRVAIRSQAPGFAGHLAKVRVDRETGQVQVTEYVAVQDVGRALNPPEVEGQISGGTAQGLGRALAEELLHDETGQPVNVTLADYALPVATQVPPVQAVLVEVPAPEGPLGAKGVGEPPAIPPAAAVTSAVEEVTGRTLSRLPLRPEEVLGLAPSPAQPVA